MWLPFSRFPSVREHSRVHTGIPTIDVDGAARARESVKRMRSGRRVRGWRDQNVRIWLSCVLRALLRHDGGFEIGHFDLQNLLLKRPAEIGVAGLLAPPINQYQYGFVPCQSST